MGINRYIIKRILQMIPTVFLIMLINFLIIHSAGDPTYALAGEDASPQFIEVIRERYGLDKPIYIQLIKYFSNTLKGDLGLSWRWYKPVLQIILERIPNTLLLVGTGQVLGLLLGIILGVFTARNYPSKIETFISTIILILYSMPLFWFGLILLIIFSVYLNLFPISGMMSVTIELSGKDLIIDRLWHLVLPVTTMSISWLMPMYQRITSASIIDIMREDFILTAKAKGLDDGAIFFKHALRSALLPTVTMAGMNLGFIFSGAILTETVFSWPGIGRLMFEATLNRDFPVLMGIFLMASITVLIANLITDIIYAILDPRIIYG